MSKDAGKITKGPYEHAENTSQFLAKRFKSSVQNLLSTTSYIDHVSIYLGNIEHEAAKETQYFPKELVDTKN